MPLFLVPVVLVVAVVEVRRSGGNSSSGSRRSIACGDQFAKASMFVITRIVFDVQLSIWRPRSCSTDGAKSVL